jgi:hypothetical protein
MMATLPLPVGPNRPAIAAIPFPFPIAIPITVQTAPDMYSGAPVRWPGFAATRRHRLLANSMRSDSKKCDEPSAVIEIAGR